MPCSGYFKLEGTSEKCYIWKYNEFNEVSNFYIHCWRVPEPVPSMVKVTILFKGEFKVEQIITENEVRNNEKRKEEPIIATVCRTSCHNKTVRYDTLGEHRPFDAIYIPNYFLLENSGEKKIQVLVEWEGVARKEFQEQASFSLI